MWHKRYTRLGKRLIQSLATPLTLDSENRGARIFGSSLVASVATGWGSIMRQHRFLRVVAVGCAVLLSTSSWAWATAKATTVEPSLGVVLMNSGKGFKQIKKTTKAKAGNSVMVSPDGAATVVYADGCRVDVSPGKVTTVAELSPCAAGSLADNGPSYHWCATPSNALDYSNPAYCAGVPVTAAVLALFGGVIYIAISP
jgi:hypothetical protein